MASTQFISRKGLKHYIEDTLLDLFTVVQLPQYQWLSMKLWEIIYKKNIEYGLLIAEFCSPKGIHIGLWTDIQLDNIKCKNP